MSSSGVNNNRGGLNNANVAALLSEQNQEDSNGQHQSPSLLTFLSGVSPVGAASQMNGTTQLQLQLLLNEQRQHRSRFLASQEQQREDEILRVHAAALLASGAVSKLPSAPQVTANAVDVNYSKSNCLDIGNYLGSQVQKVLNQSQQNHQQRLELNYLQQNTASVKRKQPFIHDTMRQKMISEHLTKDFNVPLKSLSPHVFGGNEKDNKESSTSIMGREGFKVDLKGKPGSLVVPCRARGMPIDHNFKTAYFVLPENIEHGEELICTYFSCRNAGIKFRYCSHCKQPVAKRNFRKRHKHGFTEDSYSESGANHQREDEEERSDSPEELNEVSKSQPLHVSSSSEANLPQVSSSKTRDQQTFSLSTLQVCGKVSEEGKECKQSDVSSPKNKTDNVCPPKFDATEIAENVAINNKTQSVKKNEEERASRWIALLSKRPPSEDTTAISNWLMDVLSVSDLTRPLTNNDDQINSKSDSLQGYNSQEDRPQDSSCSLEKKRKLPNNLSIPPFSSLKKYRKHDRSGESKNF